MSVKYARKFSWWWKEPGCAKAMMRLYKASPLYYGKAKEIVMPDGIEPTPVFNLKREWHKRPKKRTQAQEEAVCLKWYVERYSECAFWYELHARRAFALEGKGGVIAYLFGVPFHKLTSEQIENVLNRHNACKGNPPTERPLFAYMCSYGQDVADPATVKLMREHAGDGWTAPMLFSFNLKQCRDGKILEEIEKLLRLILRPKLQISEPPMNAGKKNRTKNTGPAFTEIEALDVFTRLPAAEAEKTGCDQAVWWRAKELIKEYFQDNNSP